MQPVLESLKDLYSRRGDEVEGWFAMKRAGGMPFLTTSVDLRHSGGRLVPVDTNLFPAGFNNLSEQACERASRMIARFLEEHHPKAERILIIPENHTRNMGYLENLSVLMSLFEALGLEVELGSFAAEKGAPVVVQAPSGREMKQYALARDGNYIALECGFTPDLVVMNHDMTSGAPELLRDIAQPVVPPVGMGWYRRRKSVHFDAYRGLITDFCRTFSLDPWLFNADFYRCGLVDFKQSEGLHLLARGVHKILTHAREKHAQYGIKEEPYVYIKAESGTYGMGVMTVSTPEEILEINKKIRNKMHTIKDGAHVSDVLIQEGIPTVDRVDGKPAEPMVYLIDGIPVGGMYRVNGERDAQINLNARGMEFVGMCDETEKKDTQYENVKDCHFRSFGTIAAIAALAAAQEDYTLGVDGAGI